jgi:TetR/AcrR family transcriptional repressor of nem operon
MTETPRTARGRATRSRIVAAAAALIRERGVAETSLDDVIEQAGVSTSPGTTPRLARELESDSHVA